MGTPDLVIVTAQPTLPANNGYTFLFDTTKWAATLAGTLGNGVGVSTPGTDRGQMADVRVKFTVKPATQNITIYRAILSGAGAWEAIDSGIVITAGNRQPFSWCPPAPEWIVYGVAGASAPSALDVTCMVSYDVTSEI